MAPKRKKPAPKVKPATASPSPPQAHKRRKPTSPPSGRHAPAIDSSPPPSTDHSHHPIYTCPKPYTRPNPLPRPASPPAPTQSLNEPHGSFAYIAIQLHEMRRDMAALLALRYAALESYDHRAADKATTAIATARADEVRPVEAWPAGVQEDDVKLLVDLALIEPPLGRPVGKTPGKTPWKRGRRKTVT